MVNVSRFETVFRDLVQQARKIPPKKEIRGKPEEYTQQQFVEPLLEALGWGKRATDSCWFQRQFEVGGVRKTWPDYALKTQRRPRVFIEVKSIYEKNVLKFQKELMEYMANFNRENPEGWVVYIGVLTNFREMHFYHYGDDRPFLSLEMETLVPENLLSSLSPSAIKDEILSSKYRETTKEPLDQHFLLDLKKWRLIIANGFYTLNDSLSREETKEASQRLLDRLIFVRVLESRGVLPPEWLRKKYVQWTDHIIGLNKSFAGVLRESFKEFESLYNTELFKWNLCDELEISDDFLEELIKVDEITKPRVLRAAGLQSFLSDRGLYGYDFSTLTLDVIGTVYERYLAHDIAIKGNRIVIEETKDLRKKEGAYYTPQHVVDYIMENTVRRKLKPIAEEVEELLSNHEFEEAHRRMMDVSRLRVLDPACGSGSFLIKAFDAIADVYDNYNSLYTRIEREWYRKKGGLVSVGEKIIGDIGTKVLLENIHGVDLDSQAVEVAKLNLWVRAITRYRELYRPSKRPIGRKELPMLELNIKHGNSLISGIIDRKELEAHTEELAELENLRSDIREVIRSRGPEEGKNLSRSRFLELREQQERLEETEKELRARINESLNENLKDHFEDAISESPFNWQVEFPEVFSLSLPVEERGFDCVVGNPPYISNWELTAKDPKMPGILGKMYEDVAVGHWDVYVLFVDRAISLARSNGRVSYIVPNAMAMEKYGTKIREKIVKDTTLESLLDFEESRVFEGVSRQSLIFVIAKRWPNGNKTELLRFREGEREECGEMDQSLFLDMPNVTFRFLPSSEPLRIKGKVDSVSLPCGEICCVNEGVVAHSSDKSPIKFKKSDVVSESPKGSVPRRYVEGKDIGRYTLEWRGLWLDYDDNKEYFHRPKYVELFEGPKIMVGRVSGSGNSLLCCFDDQGYFSNDSVLHMTIWTPAILDRQKPKGYRVSEIAQDYDLHLICAVLCSRLASWYFSIFLATDTLQGKYSGVYPEDLRRIPIRCVDSSDSRQKSAHVRLVDLGKRMLKLNRKKSKLLQLMPKEKEIEFKEIDRSREKYHISQLSGTEVKNFNDFLGVRIGELSLRKDKGTLLLEHPDQGTLMKLAFEDRRYQAYVGNMLMIWLDTERRKNFQGRIVLPSRTNLAEAIPNAVSELEEEIGIADALDLEAEIAKVDVMIDKEVYMLYGLTPKDVAVIERISIDDTRSKYGWE